ncbi:PREDICTED: uncharacterized protein LOC108365074 [Rhagoletis zephyria]|nr:PREDICTED: uncharacterized protein LOC108365074 [Rhagoletis zephyria]
MWKFIGGESEKITDDLTAVNTFFGWTIQGCYGDNDKIHCVLNTLQTHEYTFDVAKFWEIESIGINAPREPAQVDVKIYINEITKRYVVALPWKISSEYLHDNKQMARKRLRDLTARLMRDPQKLREYHEGVEELWHSGVSERANEFNNSNSTVYYMPHMPVYRDDKSTSKMRIVFDASSCQPGKTSLNYHLSTGKNCVADLLKILVKFRFDKIALTADIEKAFLQIEIADSDRDVLRFLWYKTLPTMNEELPELAEYRMQRVTFGVTSSPFLLATTIQKHLQVNEAKYEGVSKHLEKSFYVDDMVSSIANEAKAIQFFKGATDIMSGAKFNLRKWNSNSLSLKSLLVENKQEPPLVQKVLGIVWNTMSDEISIEFDNTLNYIQKLKPTKRNVLKTMARIYDPFGMLAPSTVRIKLLLQELWKEKVEWDVVMPDEKTKVFENWRRELPILRAFALPRRLTTFDNATVELHIFADASPKA